jgi:nicotinamide-nucleotide amidase
VATTGDPVADLFLRTGHTLAVAESLTGGRLSSTFAERPRASDWYRGAVVAYSSEVKHRLLGVHGPVVSEEAAVAMAQGVAKILDATAAVAVTGVGGPDPQEGQPPGTVWVGLYVDGHGVATLLSITGSPEEIVEATCRQSSDLLMGQLDDHGSRQASR